MERVLDLIFLGSKITADAAMKLEDICSLGENDKTRQQIRDITLPTKVYLVVAVVFPVVIYGCESWTMKKSACRRTYALNCGVGEDSWESLGLQGDLTSPS